MSNKKDYSRFYIIMIIILSVFFAASVIYNAIGDLEHLDKDLKFAKETGEFIIFQAEIINYCTNISNISSGELIVNFKKHKADKIINDALEGLDEVKEE